jgi:hypothetical protein
MRKAFDERADKSQWISHNEFVTMCLDSRMIGEMEEFVKKAGIVLFVKPSEAYRCRQWFMEYTVTMGLYNTLEDGDLVDLVRFMWISPIIDRATQINCTLGALGRLPIEQRKALCLAVTRLHASDIWVSSELARYLDSYEGVTANDLDHTGELHLGLWYVAGDSYECRLCSYKPPNRSNSWGALFRQLGKCSLKAWNYCKSCSINALGQCPLTIRDLCELDNPTV